MPKHPITVPLEQGDHATLEALAKAEKRSVGAQAAHMLAQVLRTPRRPPELRAVSDLKRRRQEDEQAREDRREAGSDHDDPQQAA